MKYSVLLLTIATLGFTLSAWGQTLAPLALAEMPATTEPATQPEADGPPPATADDRWHLSLAVPIWLVGVDGDLVVRDRDLSADQDTADDVDELFDSRLNGAFALHLEAEKNRIGLLLDTMYLDRSVDGTLDGTDAEGFIKGFIGEVGAFYTVVQPAPEKRGWGMLRVDALGGLRVSALEFGIDSDTFNGSVNRTFYDPYVGARAEVGLTNWLSLKVRGDVGGFGIEAWPTSTLSYNIDTGLEFHFASWFDLGLGYRWLNYDFEGDSDSSLNATLSGPVIELKFNFEAAREEVNILGPSRIADYLFAQENRAGYVYKLGRVDEAIAVWKHLLGLEFVAADRAEGVPTQHRRRYSQARRVMPALSAAVRLA